MSEPNVEVKEEDGVTTIRTGVTQTDLNGNSVSFGGLYNVVLGDGHEYVRGQLIAVVLGIRFEALPRYRDAWSEKYDGDQVRLAIYMRIGGANREAHANQIEQLTSLPYYLSDHDDAYDDTYATFYFRIPTVEEHKAAGLITEDDSVTRYNEIVEAMIEESVDEPIDMAKQWEEHIAQMGAK